LEQITLSPRATLDANQTIMVSNFLGMEAAAQVQLSGAAASYFSHEAEGSASSASWTQSTHTLALHLVQALPARGTYVLAFHINNPRLGQDSPDLYIEVTRASQLLAHMFKPRRAHGTPHAARLTLAARAPRSRVHPHPVQDVGARAGCGCTRADDGA